MGGKCNRKYSLISSYKFCNQAEETKLQRASATDTEQAPGAYAGFKAMLLLI